MKKNSDIHDRKVAHVEKQATFQRAFSNLKKLWTQHQELIFLFLISTIFFVLNLIWLRLYRGDGILDVDEAGYLSIALRDLFALKSGGIISWIKMVEAPSAQSPVTTALTSLVSFIFGPHIIAGFVIIILSGVATILGSYYLGKFFGGFRLGVVASILVATCPMTLSYTRAYLFALPATAVTTIALLALVRSDHFTRLKWALLFGICLGLMPLTRTMTIAFLPGLVLGAFISVATQSKNKIYGAQILGVSLSIAVIVAAMWLMPNDNGNLVFQYLTSFGYGNRVAAYAASGSSNNLFDRLLAWWPTTQYVARNIFLPDFAVLCVGVLILGVIALTRTITKGGVYAAKLILRSSMLPILIFILEGLLALSSSQNKGTGFLLPLVPAMLLFAAWALMKVKRGRFWNAVIIGFITAVALISAVPALALDWPTAQLIFISVPYLGDTAVTDGRACIQLYETAGGYHTANPVYPISKQTAALWANADEVTATKLTQHGGDHILTIFGFRNDLFNPSSLNVRQLLAQRSELPVLPVVPEINGDSIQGYTQWFKSGDAPKAGLLLTATEYTTDPYSHTVNPVYVETAAKSVGFSPIDHWSLPDGVITLWKR